MREICQSGSEGGEVLSLPDLISFVNVVARAILKFLKSVELRQQKLHLVFRAPLQRD
jgi:hypothetical protein